MPESDDRTVQRTVNFMMADANGSFWDCHRGETVLEEVPPHLWEAWRKATEDVVRAMLGLTKD